MHRNLYTGCAALAAIGLMVIAPRPAGGQPPTPVKVMNGSTEAVPVRHAGPVQVFQTSATFTIPSGLTAPLSTPVLTTVPTAKRLVIESVTVRADTPTGNHIHTMALNVVSGSGSLVDLLMTKQLVGSINDVWVGTHSVRAYADAGSPVTAQVLRYSGLGTTTLRILIAGYLMDL
ncbi:MAG: hypothetical protein HY013_05700 [Candidatus Solibacter usitatus]|nr:hypothetical protein [Candidatus Solibacter usitatus]